MQHLSARRPFRSTLALFLMALPLAGAPAPLAAQATLPMEQPLGQPLGQPTAVQWWHGALLVGGISALMLLDNPIRHGSQDLRGGGTDGFAGSIRRFGQPEVYATTTAALLTAGLLTGDPEITGAGRRVAASLALTAGLVYAGKFAFGRARPDDLFRDADDFRLLSGGDPALPSGHTAMAFAFATSLADEINRPWATIGLYTAAGAVGWSRINDDRHWFSDVATGAVLGIASAKLASGRWTIFGLRAPSIITGPQGTGLGWQAQF